jgi:purine-binding chemotaxis protein CheW
MSERADVCGSANTRGRWFVQTEERGTRAAGEGELHLLCVDVAGQHCGLPVDAVVEIHPAVQLAPLPDAPQIVAGLVNRRGHALPVLDLRTRLGLPPRPLKAADRLVVLRLPDREAALLVDAAVDVITIDAELVDEAVLRSTQALLSQSVVVLPDGLLVVLDVASFLSSTDIAALEAAMQQALTASS